MARQSDHQPNQPAQTTDSSTSEPLDAALSVAQDQVETYRSRTDAMINSLGEGLIMMDEQGMITTVNRYALEALGCTEAELMGKWFPRAIAAVDAQGRSLERLDRPVVRAMSSGQTVSDYAYYIRQDGTRFPVFITVSPVLVGDQPTGAVEVFRDLTTEQQLDMAKDEFVSLASHQLRTPANGVLSILSMLAAGDFGPLTDMQQRYVEKALATNQRQLQIINDLLHAAHVDAGKMQLQLEYVELTGLLRQSAADQAALLEPRGQTIAVDLPQPCRALLDIGKIRMVIDNLVSNASKYSPDGAQIRIELVCTSREHCIRVIDQGVGIAAADIKRIFTKFTRLDNIYTTAVGGSGLGLFLVKSVIDLHRGEVTVASRPEGGSIFTVKIPTK